MSNRLRFNRRSVPQSVLSQKERERRLEAFLDSQVAEGKVEKSADGRYRLKPDPPKPTDLAATYRAAAASLRALLPGAPETAQQDLAAAALLLDYAAEGAP